MSGRTDQSTPRWSEWTLRDDFLPNQELPTRLRDLARSSFEHNPERRAAFLQAAERIEELEQLLAQATQDTPSQELALLGYPGYSDELAARVLLRVKTFGQHPCDAIERVVA